MDEHRHPAKRNRTSAPPYQQKVPPRVGWTETEEIARLEALADSHPVLALYSNPPDGSGVGGSEQTYHGARMALELSEPHVDHAGQVYAFNTAAIVGPAGRSGATLYWGVCTDQKSIPLYIGRFGSPCETRNGAAYIPAGRIRVYASPGDRPVL